MAETIITLNSLERRRPTAVSAVSLSSATHSMAKTTSLARLLPKPPQTPPYCGRDVVFAIERVVNAKAYLEHGFPQMQPSVKLGTTSLARLLPKPPQSLPGCDRDV